MEAMVPGAVVSEIARRWQVCPQQVFGWRREARASLPAAAAVDLVPETGPGFMPIVAEPESPSTTRAPGGVLIEVGLAGAVLRVSPGVDGDALTMVLRAVCASAAVA